MPQKTSLPAVKTLEATRKWHHIDLDGQVLGRAATKIAGLLRGKTKPVYTPHLDCGDFVVVTNAAKLRLTGNKTRTKSYFSHSGYAGGAKRTLFTDQMEKDPTKVVHLAVKRMLNTDRLRAKQLKRLRVFAGAEHDFTGRKFEGSK